MAGSKNHPRGELTIADETTLRGLFRVGSRARDALDVRFDGQRAFVQIREQSGASLLELVVVRRDDDVECYRRTQRYNISLHGTGHTPAQLALAQSLIKRAIAREQVLVERSGEGGLSSVPSGDRNEAVPDAAPRDVASVDERPREAVQRAHRVRAKRPGVERLVLCHQESNSASFQMTPTATRTLGSFLARQLPEHLWEILVLDLDSAATVEEMFERVAATEPDVVGLSCYVWNTQAMFGLCGWIHKRLPRVKVVLGGPHLHYDENDLSRIFRTNETTHELISSATMSCDELKEVNARAREAMGRNRPRFDDAIRAVHAHVGRAPQGRDYPAVRVNRDEL